MIKVEKNSVINIDDERVSINNVDMVYCNDNNITITTANGNHTVKFKTHEEARKEFEVLTQNLLQNPNIFKVDGNIFVNIANLKRTEVNSIPTDDGKKEHIMVLRFKTDAPAVECGSREEMLELAYKINAVLTKKNNVGV